MPNSRPRVNFNSDNVCNACINGEDKKRLVEERREEFLEYINSFKIRNGLYDCIVPWSGGKDSSAMTYKLKFEFGLNPLLVTASP